jgi:hypothetical protein
MLPISADTFSPVICVLFHPMYIQSGGGLSDFHRLVLDRSAITDTDRTSTIGPWSSSYPGEQAVGSLTS